MSSADSILLSVFLTHSSFLVSKCFVFSIMELLSLHCSVGCELQGCVLFFFFLPCLCELLLYHLCQKQ